MSSGSSKYPGLIRFNKTGEMRLKNKVGNAILKENAYEERALKTRLQTIKKHQVRNDKYLTYRQLDFATRQISASEERPCTKGNSTDSTSREKSALGLPPINDNAKKTGSMSRSTPELRKCSSDTAGNDKIKGKWEKAITLVRLAVQSQKREQDNERRENRTFVTQVDGSKGQSPRHSAGLSVQCPENKTSLPPITLTTPQTRGERARKKGLQRHLSFPEMLQTSRKKSQLGLQDPRFQRLEQCLQEGLSGDHTALDSAHQNKTTRKRRGSRHRAPNDPVSTF